jgi:hypothetical protein
VEIGKMVRLIDVDSISDADMERARKAVEDELVYRCDARISVLRNNGACIKEKDGERSSIIRMSIEDVMLVGMRAITDRKKK